MEEKKEIRKKIFKARKEHTDAWIRENSLRITEALTQLPEYRNAERIMAYADYNHEVITRYIIEQAWKDGKEVAVPKVFGKDMVFYRLTDFSQRRLRFLWHGGCGRRGRGDWRLRDHARIPDRASRAGQRR